jgi:hypothetical protein
MGVLTRCGGERIFHFMKSEYNSGKCITAIDCVNAFNCVSRLSIWNALHKHVGLETLQLPFLFEYGSPTKLFYRPGRASILSQRGVRQGSVFGPIFFAAALQPILVEAAKQFPTVSFRAYLDDICFSSSINEVAPVIKFLKPRLSQLGLEIHSDKSFTSLQKQPTAPPTDLPFQLTIGARILGAFVGDIAYIKKELLQKVSDKDMFWERLSSLGNRISTLGCFLSDLLAVQRQVQNGGGEQRSHLLS